MCIETSASGVGSSLHQIAFRFGSVRGCTVRSTTLKWLPLLLVMIQAIREQSLSSIWFTT
ncbi:unnamed protein product [Linum tenue]|uniref:Uncharacterized protein n=1 Tax=Linum tenue TaxID=586396 RepID=A0AAV0P4I6_9ROSI|nr:unnamed protein product [Linum tenue]